MDTNPGPPDSSQPPPPPPPLRPPPVIVAPASTAAPRRRGRGWMIFAFILLVLLALSLFLNLGQIMGSLGGGGLQTARGGPRLEEVVLENNGSSRKLAVIDLQGIITSDSVDQGEYSLADVIKAQLDRAGEDTRVKAVILRVDSPGGEVLASDEIYRHLVNFQDECGKPVVTSMGSLAASGGYYVAAASRWIVANELTITGSIGVILHSWNYRGLMNKVGLRPEIYKSGRFKDMLSGSRNPEDIPPEERKMVQDLIDETYQRFQKVVAEGRETAHLENEGEGKALADDWRDYADGRILSGAQAYALGFVDELGSYRTAVNRAKKLAELEGEANLVQYRQRYDLSSLLRMFGKSEAPVIKVDVGMDTPRLEAGTLYFLSPTLVH